MKKRIFSLVLTLALCLALTVPASAAGYAWPIEQVEMGSLGTFVVTSDHCLYTWGEYDSDFWEEWGGAKGNVYAPLWSGKTMKQATKVMDDVQAVAASKYATFQKSYSDKHMPILMILKTDGSVWMWGENCYGQLGQGYTENLRGRSDFSLVKVMDGVKKIACSGNLCAAITNNGDLYCWGFMVGAPGGGTGVEYKYTTMLTPTKMLSNVTAVSMGSQHTLALTADGTVYAMGSQSNGRLGNGAEKGEPVTEMIRVMDGCTAVSAGRVFSMALGADGTVYAWGHNGSCVFGKLTDEVPDYLTPTPILSNVKQIFAGEANAAYIKTDNSLWITGNNLFGVHGQGQQMYDPWTDSNGYPFPCKYTPVQVDTNVKTVALHAYAMLYVKNDGVMYGTGSSVEGVPEYTYQDKEGAFQVSTNPAFDAPAAVCSPTLAGTGRTPYVAPPVPTVGGFTDVKKSDFFADPVLWAVGKNITTGTGGGTFSPNTPCSRGEILTFLWRAKGSPAPQGSGSFPDVGSGAFYAQAAQWALEQGLVEGGAFNASAPCTRADVVTYLWKLAGSPAGGGAAFSDVPANASYAPAVAWAVRQGITTGAGDGSAFDPAGTCTRGQIVTFLYRALA